MRTDPASTRASSASVATPCACSPRTSAASRTSQRGTTRPDGAVASARAIMPGTWRSDPLRPSSPQKASPSVLVGLISPVATRRPTAMGRSRPGAAFADARRGQVDGDPAERPRQPAREDGGAHAVACLPDGRVGQADDRESGQPVGDVDLDRDSTAESAVSVADSTAASMRENGRGSRDPVPSPRLDWS